MSSLRLTIYSLGFSLILTGSSSILELLETIGNSVQVFASFNSLVQIYKNNIFFFLNFIVMKEREVKKRKRGIEVKKK